MGTVLWSHNMHAKALGHLYRRTMLLQLYGKYEANKIFFPTCSNKSQIVCINLNELYIVGIARNTQVQVSAWWMWHTRILWWSNWSGILWYVLTFFIARCAIKCQVLIWHKPPRLCKSMCLLAIHGLNTRIQYTLKLPKHTNIMALFSSNFFIVWVVPWRWNSCGRWIVQ